MLFFGLFGCLSLVEFVILWITLDCANGLLFNFAVDGLVDVNFKRVFWCSRYHFCRFGRCTTRSDGDLFRLCFWTSDFIGEDAVDKIVEYEVSAIFGQNRAGWWIRY